MNLIVKIMALSISRHLRSFLNPIKILKILSQMTCIFHISIGKERFRLKPIYDLIAK